MANGENGPGTNRRTKNSLGSQKVSGQDWFYHAPRTEKDKSIKSSQVLPVSQIPGIGDLDNSPVNLHEDIHLRRKWFRETDSKYVRLAKEGGRKDLFKYREHKPSHKGAVHYPRVDWFDHYDDKTQINVEDGTGTTYKSAYPEWYIHEENQQNREVETPLNKKRQILAFDDMSYWKREAIEQEERRIKSTPVKLPSLAKSKGSKTKLKQGSNGEAESNALNDTKFPVINPTKKPEVKIGQLLSMQYQRDWLAEQDEKKKVTENKKFEDVEKEKQKSYRDQKYVKRIKDKNIKAQEDKDLFKLSRFANVPAKTDSYRT